MENVIVLMEHLGSELLAELAQLLVNSTIQEHYHVTTVRITVLNVQTS